MDVWEKLPDKNKAWFESWGVVLYEEILDIDERGDEWAEYPHVYVLFEHDGRPFKYTRAKVQNVTAADGERVSLVPQESTRVVFFHDDYRRFPGDPKATVPTKRASKKRR
jgi:hypothetical protein